MFIIEASETNKTKEFTGVTHRVELIEITVYFMRITKTMDFIDGLKLALIRYQIL